MSKGSTCLHTEHVCKCCFHIASAICPGFILIGSDAFDANAICKDCRYATSRVTYVNGTALEWKTDISHDKGDDGCAATKSTLFDSLLLLLSQNVIIQVFEAGFKALRNAVPAVRAFQPLTALWGL